MTESKPFSLLARLCMASVAVAEMAKPHSVSELNLIQINAEVTKRKEKYSKVRAKTMTNKTVANSSVSSNAHHNLFNGESHGHQQLEQQAPQSIKQKVFVMGMPKAGTTSILKFFQCGMIPSSHWDCGAPPLSENPQEPSIFCGHCIRDNVISGRDPIAGCGNYDVWAEMSVWDTTVYGDPRPPTYFPQIEAIEQLHTFYPDSVWILNLRPAGDWADSVSTWFDMAQQMQTHFGWSDGNIRDSLKAFYFNHTNFIRNFSETRGHKLVTIDITSSNASSILSHEFNISATCWEHHNHNSPDSEPSLAAASLNISTESAHSQQLISGGKYRVVDQGLVVNQTSSSSGDIVVFSPLVNQSIASNQTHIAKFPAVLGNASVPFKLEHIFFINLDSRTDRRRQIEAEFAARGMNATRYSAWDAHDPNNQAELEGCYTPLDVCHGAYGCWKSHYNLISYAIEQKLPHVAILEDDFQFQETWNNTDFKSTIEKAVSGLDEWNVIGFSFSALADEGSASHLCDASVGTVGEGIELVKVWKALSTSGYLVNGEYLATLREALSPEICPVKQSKTEFSIDVCCWPLMTQGKWFAFYPQPGRQRVSFSDIEQHVTDYTDLFQGISYRDDCFT